MGLLALVGLLVLAVGGRYPGGWPIGPSTAVVGACIAVIAVGVFGMATNDGDRLAADALFVDVAAALVLAWLGVGATLIRRPS